MMMLLQFSTSHYCRKARLALGYKQIHYQVENLNPGLHIQIKTADRFDNSTSFVAPRVRTTSIADSTRILKYLETYCPEPRLILPNHELQTTAWMLEDWLDESIGTATRSIITFGLEQVSKSTLQFSASC